MSKGIVKKTPPVTKRLYPGKLLVKEVEGADNQGLLETEIDFYNPDFLVMLEDYVEFQLNLSGWAHVNRFVYNRGKILTMYNPATYAMGTLEVTVANPNAGVHKGAILSYQNEFAVPLAVGDYVEFHKISEDKTLCFVNRRIECVGAVDSLPGANPGSMTVKSAGANTQGLTAGSPLSLTLGYIGNAPFHVGDVVEYRVVAPGNGRFVQIVSRA